MMHYGLFYERQPTVLERYSYAIWIISIIDNKLAYEWIFKFANGAISWASKKQTCLTYSTVESKLLLTVGEDDEGLQKVVPTTSGNYIFTLW